MLSGYRGGAMTALNRPHLGKLLALPAALLASVLLVSLTACTHGGDQAPSSSPTPSGAAVVDINSQPRSVIADGGEFRLPVSDFGSQWNPLHADVSSDTKLITSTLLPQLFTDDDTGNPTPNPDYLAAVNATGDNPQVVTYTLNPSATWANGRAIDAGDFIADWKACDGQNVSFKCADTKGYAQVASVKKGSTPQQVIVTYRSSYDDWPSTFNTLLPAGSVKDPDTFNNGWTSLDDIKDWLSGPFTVADDDTKHGLLTEKPNPDWWGDQPKLAQLTFRAYDPKDQLAALQANKIDAVDLTQDSSQASKVSDIPNCEVREAAVSDSSRQVVATRTSVANYGAFGKSSPVWADVGYLPPNA